MINEIVKLLNETNSFPTWCWTLMNYLVVLFVTSVIFLAILKILIEYTCVTISTTIKNIKGK